MVESGVAPRTFIMAHGTVGRESCRCMVRVSCSSIIRHVTRLAGVGCVRIARCVALVAVHVGVRAVQGEAGRCGVVEA